MAVKRQVLFIIGFFCSLFSFSQNVIVNRVEGIEDTMSFYGCIPFAEQGMLLKAYYPEKNTSRKIDVFTYEKFDTALQKKNSLDVRTMEDKPDYLALFCKPLLASLLMAFCARGVYALLHGRLALGGLVSVAGAVGSAVIVYFVLVLALHIITAEDLSLLPKGDKVAKVLRIR